MATEPLLRLYRKKTFVLAYQAETEGTIETLEGAMHYQPGDWILGPGAGGEFWPVRDDVFRATYEEVPTVGAVTTDAEDFSTPDGVLQRLAQE